MPVTSTLLDQAHDAVERKLFAMKGFTTQAGANRRFTRDSRTCTTSSRINVEPSTRASVAWKWQAGEYRPTTGSSTSKSSPQEAFDEW
jgi:hypothetical protein